MKALLAAVVTCCALNAFAASPAAPPGGAKDPYAGLKPQRGGPRGDDDRDGPMMGGPEREKRMRMMLVVGIAEALSLSEGEALRLSDKIKAFDERRRTVREGMHESMRVLKAAADGDAAAAGQVDGAIQKVLEGRQQMAAVDKEMFLAVSKDLAPQKRAQLALFLAKFQHEAMKHMGGGKGRRFGPR